MRSYSEEVPSRSGGGVKHIHSTINRAITKCIADALFLAIAEILGLNCFAAQHGMTFLIIKRTFLISYITINMVFLTIRPDTVMFVMLREEIAIDSSLF